MIDGSQPVEEDSLLLTFDDGFASNRVLAERVLNPLNIKALFFIVTDFAALTDPIEINRFVADHFFPGQSIYDLPGTYTNMNWSDLEALLEQGHDIGAHTATHARLTAAVPIRQVEREIFSCVESLEMRLGVHINHFAWPFGDIESFSHEAFITAKKRFKYIYSGLRGNNSKGTSPLAIRRDAISTVDSSAITGALLEGGADFRYRASLKILDQWALNS
jgi:peptidoglycan/xylan/chitin deacetylase (PgdA/CDA1 family)